MINSETRQVTTPNELRFASDTWNLTQAQWLSAGATAKHNGLQRLVQALFREGLLDSSQLIFDSRNGVAWLPHWKNEALFRFDGLRRGVSGSWQLNGHIHYIKRHQEPAEVLSPSAALKLFANLFETTPSASDVARLQDELGNSTDNDLLCLAYRQAWADRLVRTLPPGAGFIAWLRKLSDQGGDSFNGCLMLEQWGTQGHPWHPNYKTKLGLTPEDVIAMSPEFEADIDISFAAVRADVMHVETMTASAGARGYLTWFSNTFPQIMNAWEEALRKRNLIAADWLPLPMHPWQARRQIPTEFSAEIAQGQLIQLDEVTLKASPTMSFRTVVPQRSSRLPLMKLPVALRLTSVQRTLSPKSAVMGPRVSALLKHILERESGFDGMLDIVCEPIGVHYIDPTRNDDHARHLSVLYRDNPMLHARKGLFPIPVGVLFTPSPVPSAHGRPLVVELVAGAFEDNRQGAADFYRRYVEVAVAATLGAYLLYGIGFEAHQQNSFMLIDSDGMPQKLLLRDFGDIRIHADALQAAGLTLDCYKAGQTVLEDRDQVRDKLLHAVFLCHLGELALLLTRTYDLPQLQLWSILREVTHHVFEELKPRIPDTLWQHEYARILEQPWPAKSFVRMRLSESSDDDVRTMHNPLACSVDGDMEATDDL